MNLIDTQHYPFQDVKEVGSLFCPVKLKPETRENSVLHYLLNDLKLTTDDKSTHMKILTVRHEWDKKNMKHYTRCPGGFLGMRPFSMYTAVGYDIIRRLDLKDNNYIHHANIIQSNTILVTDKKILSVIHNKTMSFLKTEWTLDIEKVHNLSMIEDDKIVINLSEDLSSDPIIIQCDIPEKLRSVQLAVEYAVLLSLPYKSSIYCRQ